MEIDSKEKLICIIEPVGAQGGNDIYSMELLKSIDECKGLCAFLVTCDVTQSNDSRVFTLFKGIYGKDNLFKRGVRYLYYSFSSIKFARKNKADLIHLHLFGFSFREYVLLFLAKVIFQFKVVATIHDVESFENFGEINRNKQTPIKFMKLLDGIIFHTNYAKSKFESNIGLTLIPSEVVYASDFVYEGLDRIRKSSTQSKIDLGIDKNKKVILFFGQIKKVKGLEILLRSLKEIIKNIPDIALLIAGKVWKDDFKYYQNIIDSLGLNDYVVKHIKFISNEDLPDYFYASDAVILPYKEIYNSGVLIRSMSFGIPVIASDIGAFREFIHDKKNGFIFEKGSYLGLANTIVNTLKDTQLCELVSLKEVRFLKDNFNPDSLGKKYRGFYMEVLDNEGKV